MDIFPLTVAALSRRCRLARLTLTLTAIVFSGTAEAQLTVQDLDGCGAPGIATLRTTTLRGKQELTLEWRRPPEDAVVLLVREQDIDVDVTLNGETADSPVRRAGSQLMLVPAGKSRVLAMRLRGKDPSNVHGRVFVSAHRLPADPGCADYLRQVAAGDHGYAAAEATPADRSRMSKVAAQAYAGAESLAIRSHWPALSGHAQLAIAAANYQGHNDWIGSQAAGLRATQSFANAKRRYFEARAASMAAAAMLESGNGANGGNPYEEARALLERAIAVFRADSHPYDEALQTNNVALSYLYESDFPRCVATSQRAIPQFESLGDRHRVALARQNLALCHWGLGQLRMASELLDRAIPILRDAPLPINYTTTLNNGALAHYALGEFDRSILLHAEGERVATQFAMPRERAQSLYGLGVTYGAIGDFAAAEEYLRRSLEIRTAELDRRGRMASLRALAAVLDSRGEFRRADEADGAALEIASNEVTRTRIELRLMQRRITAGAITPTIRARLAEILEGRPTNDRMVSASARQLSGLIAAADGDVRSAYAALEAARTMSAELQQIDGEFDACFASARLAHRIRDFPRAREDVSCAARLAEEMRAQVVNPELRANVSQLRRDAADLEVRIAADDPANSRNAGERVLAVMERHRGRLLDDYATVDLNPGADAADLRRQYDELATARSQLADAQARGNVDTARAIELRRRVAEQRLALFRAEDQLRTRGGVTSPGHPPGTAEPRLVPEDTAVIEYWLGPARSFAVVLTRGGPRLQELAATALIDRQVRDFRAALGDESADGALRSRRAIQEISRLVWSPLKLDAAIRQVIFVSDGSLNFVPMAALCLDDRCERSLIERMRVANTTSVFRLLNPRSAATDVPSRVLIVADPVYQANDPRLSHARSIQAGPERVAEAEIARLRGGRDVRALRRLPATAKEARLVASRYPAHDVDMLLGLDANREKVLALEFERYGVIHFAVHGLSDEDVPQLSALALSRFRRDGGAEDGRLWSGDLLQRRFKANLVFLSACDTAIGPQFSGEGLVSLSFVLLSRGANNVISSLWPVEDVMTSQLVADVYARMRSGETAAGALAGAQRAYLEKNDDRDFRRWAAWSATVGSTEVP